MAQTNNPRDEEQPGWDEASSETEIDPVCGMEVDRARAVGSSHYEGTRYYFCSEECKLSFDASPEEYVGNDDSARV
jgi:YHS domain-containing protein